MSLIGLFENKKQQIVNNKGNNIMIIKKTVIALAIALMSASSAFATVQPDRLSSVNPKVMQFEFRYDKDSVINAVNQSITNSSGMVRLKEDAKRGDAESQYVLYHVYKYGVAHDIDFDLAYEYLTQAVESNHPKALFHYSMYLMGYNPLDKQTEKLTDLSYNGVNELASPYEIGLSLIKQSASLQDPESQYVLGLHYIQGKSITKDRDIGLFWLSQSYSNGYIQAGIAREKLFSNSDYLEDFNQAQKDAKYGSDVALVKLAEFYLTDDLVEKDEDKARRLLNTAKILGNERAVLVLKLNNL